MRHRLVVLALSLLSLPALSATPRPVVSGHLGNAPRSLVVIAADLERRAHAGTVKKTEQNGWTVYSGKDPLILISFLPTTDPAYPAAVMATTGPVDILQCEGERAACTALEYRLNHPQAVIVTHLPHGSATKPAL